MQNLFFYRPDAIPSIPNQQCKCQGLCCNVGAAAYDVGYDREAGNGTANGRPAGNTDVTGCGGMTQL